eukprot:CAMPEP_0201601530 /NCGR_PEP_ID=MMETSP0492-20130828/2486_1 /ASSEMBLY_ACC=CAM_ASM_000837 /TAXON_ID=420259 /ORGANISM="Thalassiosira gravida, Strain GMp14c1" /LENGTH=59 /DNA_ID=CAMNT_0048064793 /DNA_START=420 /DNA_END=599 /DNA_ORIENTATION=+
MTAAPSAPLVVLVYVTSCVCVVIGGRTGGSTIHAAIAATNHRTVAAIAQYAPMAMEQAD